MKKLFLSALLILSTSSFTMQSVAGPYTCIKYADDELDAIVTDPNFGEPMTYEQEHELWLAIYDFCVGGLQNYQG